MAIIKTMATPMKASVPYTQFRVLFMTMRKTMATRKRVATSFHILKNPDE
jgi:hypothetical protein